MGVQALQDTSQHVPRDQYTLENSGISASDRKAVDGKFTMRWSTPYAQYLWHGEVMYGNPTNRTYGPENGHIYQVYVTLDENDYLKINSRENSVVQYLANGTQRDLYDYRVKITGSLFDPITPGNVRVVWSGEFGFDLTLFCERSEPRWKTQDS